MTVTPVVSPGPELVTVMVNSTAVSSSAEPLLTTLEMTRSASPGAAAAGNAPAAIEVMEMTKAARAAAVFLH